MAQFDVHAGTGGDPLLIDIQSGFHDHIRTRVVIPLLPAKDAPPAAPRLNPVFDLGGQMQLMPQLMAAVDREELGPVVASLAAERDRITAAIDVLIGGV